MRRIDSASVPATSPCRSTSGRCRTGRLHPRGIGSLGKASVPGCMGQPRPSALRARRKLRSPSLTPKRRLAGSSRAGIWFGLESETPLPCNVWVHLLTEGATFIGVEGQGHIYLGTGHPGSGSGYRPVYALCNHGKPLPRER